MAPKPLPPSSRLLHFRLFPSLANANTPCPCIVAELPFRDPPSTDSSSSLAVTIDDLRRSSRKACIEVVRILDPEHHEPFVSLSRIFLACGLSPLEGLLRFGLERPGYDSGLGGIAPFKDIWVPLATARRVAQELDVLVELAALLEWETRTAWSVEDREVGGIVHNWRISTDRIDPASYSTEAMLATPFPRLHLLPSSTQVRTLTSPALSSIRSFSTVPTSYAVLHSKIVEWTILEYESFLDAPLPSSSQHSSADPDLTLASLYTSLFSLLLLQGALPRDISPEGLGNAYVVGGIKISRRDVTMSGGEMDRGLGSLGLVDAVSRLAGVAWRRALEDEIPRGVIVSAETKEVEVEVIELAMKDEMEGLRRRIERLEEREIEGEKVGHVRSSDIEALRRRMNETEAYVARFETEKRKESSRKMAQESKPEGVSLANIVLLALVIVLAVPQLRAYI